MLGALALTALSLVARPCLAASGPFGVATPDSPAGMGWSGPFAGLVARSMQAQAYFHGRLTDAVDHFPASPHALAWLVGLSLLYGVFHAVGPGHGKAVISSYLLSTGDSLRRAAAISFAASLMQAFVAIGLVLVGTLAFHVTAAGMAGMTDMVAIASYGLIAMIGLVLLVARTRQALGPPRFISSGQFVCEQVETRGLGGPGAAGEGAWLSRLRQAVRRGWRGFISAGHHVHGAACGCVPTRFGGAPIESLSWPRLLPLIASVGIRPCSGALIVLVFSLSGGVLPAGIVSVVAMALGTGATIALIALMSVVARDTLTRAASVNSVLASRVSLGLQLTASLIILAFGLTMLAGALALQAAG
ncbi:ABC-type nickel/cobalt efflux system permease component RcnA [Hoeflea marina]|uniref:Nickel/cobalt efflux system n=1 Tax=Hoeflea marina TaxID=274592 RepID=A0A317PIR5_9HYPH|nr:nickel transporter [Hoeflea marina]PWV99097.1 ABC-type nickel/cobalt efflux system permease component RcnA [Hoeflea marina]